MLSTSVELSAEAKHLGEAVLHGSKTLVAAHALRGDLVICGNSPSFLQRVLKNGTAKLQILLIVPPE